MATLNAGLIGLGQWARQAYLPLLKERFDVQVAAVAARSEETRNFAQEAFGPELLLYSDYHELLSDDQTDVVLISLPNELHSSAINEALDS